MKLKENGRLWGFSQNCDVTVTLMALVMKASLSNIYFIVSLKVHYELILV